MPETHGSRGASDGPQAVGLHESPRLVYRPAPLKTMRSLSRPKPPPPAADALDPTSGGDYTRNSPAAGWQSGDAEDCKSSYPSSILGSASTLPRLCVSAGMLWRRRRAKVQKNLLEATAEVAITPAPRQAADDPG
jgi:hypothetical protein